MGENSLSSGADSPRYSQLPNRDSPRNVMPSFGVKGSGDSLGSPRNPSGQQEARDSPRNTAASLGATEKGSTLDSPRCVQSPQESPRNVPVYVNEPFGGLPGTSSSSKDWPRPPALFHRESSKLEGLSRAQPPRSSFNSSQELQTFYPAPRSVTSRLSGSKDRLAQGNPRSQREAPIGSRDARLARDWQNDSIATTDDCDDQRSTTTSGSYTIDNEDNYVGLDLNHSPWKDVVV